MLSEEKKQTIKMQIAVSILIFIFLIIVIIMIKYEVEGEKDMPFQLSKMVVISTAEGVEQKDGTQKWNFDLYQNNDFYFYINQNEKSKSKDELIKSVKIDNVEIIKAPQKGNVKIYMPNSKAGRLYSYDEQFLVEDKLEYNGASQSSSTNLEVGSKGGLVYVRFSNANVGVYASDEEQEVVHNGSLLSKVSLTSDEINFQVSFHMTIQTTKNSYESTITMDLPTGDLLQEGTGTLEKTDGFVFKRVK